MDAPLDSAALLGKLARIRDHKSSKLENQKKLAIILSAVEESLDEEKTERTPVAYFVSFLALLNQSVTDDEEDGIKNIELASSTLYFLDLIAPYASPSLLKAKFVAILSKLRPVLASPKADAPILRSSIGILETLLSAQDAAGWALPPTQASPSRGLLGLMVFGLDPRPKVRKRAQLAISNILKAESTRNSESSTGLPAAALAAESSLNSCQTVLSEYKSYKANAKKGADPNAQNPSTSRLIHSMQLIKFVIINSTWPQELIDRLCEVLLSISRLSEVFIVTESFNVVEVLFNSIVSNKYVEVMPKLFESIIDLKPSVEDKSLAPAWFMIISKAIEAYTQLSPFDSLLLLPNVFTLVSDFFSSESEDIQSSAAHCLIAVCELGISQKVLLQNTPEHKKYASQIDEVFESISSTLFQLLNVKYQSSWKDVMMVVVALSNALMWRSDPYMIKLFKVIGTLRSAETLSDGWQEADLVMGAAVKNIGPIKTLELFPLNLESDAKSSRPWLLPIIRDNTEFSQLKFFTDKMVNLSGQIEASISELANDKKSATKVKVLKTLVDQIWSLFPSFCHLPIDNLEESFTSDFAQLIMTVAYDYPELRNYIFSGLKNLIETNQAFIDGAFDENLLLLEIFNKEKAQHNMGHLKSFSLNILASLFNIFTVTPTDSRTQLLECSKAFLSITSPEDLETTFNRVSSILNESLKDASQGADKENDIPPTSATMLDLIIQMAPFLSEANITTLFTIFSTLCLNYKTSLIQKRTYRLFSTLAELPAGQALLKKHSGDVINLFIQTLNDIQPPARGQRLQAIASFLTILSPEDLYFIPSVISEVVIATKDLNEKTREAAFGLLVSMGQLMSQKGGKIDRSKIPDIPAELATVVDASLEEYITIIAAGLSDTTTHTQAATILALSRVVFEFKSSLQLEMLQELTSTVEMFLEHKGREVADATLGYIKVAVSSLPKEVVEPSLKNLIEHLLSWYREHSSHFKAKIKHLIERLIRIFGYDKVAENFPEDDLKFLNNIRKSKERAKRKKLQAATADEEGSGLASHRNRKHFAQAEKFASEFDRALYDSSSDEEDEDGDVEMDDNNGKHNRSSNERFITEGDDPLDLLDSSALARIGTKNSNKKAGLSDSKKFKKDMDGKIIIKHLEAEDNDEDDDPLANIGNSLSAYEEAIKNGPVRDARGKYHYKRGRHNMDDADDMSDNESSSKSSRKVGNNKRNDKLGPKKASGKNNRGFKGSADKKKKTAGNRRFYN